MFTQPVSFAAPDADCAEPYQPAYEMAMAAIREIHAAAQRDLGLGESLQEMLWDLAAEVEATDLAQDPASLLDLPFMSTGE